MAELLEEEERERNKKIKKRERKKQRRNKLQAVKTKCNGDVEKMNCDEIGNENRDQLIEKHTEILHSKTKDTEVIQCNGKNSDFHHKEEKRNLKYENVTENARTSKSRRYAKSKNFLDEVSAQSNYGTNETQSETQNDKWVTVQTRKANSRPDTSTLETDSQDIKPSKKLQSNAIDQQKGSKRWADVARSQIFTKHCKEKPVNSLANDCEVSVTVHGSLKEKHKYKRGDYEDDFPSLDPKTSSKRNSPIEQRRKSNESNSPMIDEWCPEECPDEWTARSTSSTPTELERYSSYSDSNNDDNQTLETLDLIVENTPGTSYQNSTEAVRNTGEMNRDVLGLSNTCIDFGFVTTDEKEKAIESALDTAKYTFSKAQMTYWQNRDFVPLLYENGVPHFSNTDDQVKMQVGKNRQNMTTTTTKTENSKSYNGKRIYTTQPAQSECISDINHENQGLRSIRAETKSAEFCDPNLKNVSYKNKAQPVVDEVNNIKSNNDNAPQYMNIGQSIYNNRKTNTHNAHHYMNPTNHIQTEPSPENFGESEAVKNWLRNDSFNMMSKPGPHIVDNRKFNGGSPLSVSLDKMKYSNKIDTLIPNYPMPWQQTEPQTNPLAKASEKNIKKDDHTKATNPNIAVSDTNTTNNISQPNATTFFTSLSNCAMASTQNENKSDRSLVDSNNQHLNEATKNNLNCTRTDSYKLSRNCLNGQANADETENWYLSSNNLNRVETKSKMAEKEFDVNSIAVVKPLGPISKRGNDESSRMTSNNTCSDKNCDLGESILRNVANLDIADEDVWYPSRLRGEPEEQQPRQFSSNQTNIFPGFHDNSSTEDNDRDTFDFGFSDIKKLASYQLQKQYNEVRKRGPVYGSLYFHDIPYYASCLGISEHELERSFVSDLKTTFQCTNEQQTVNDIVQLNEHKLNVAIDATSNIADNLQDDNIPDLYNFTPDTTPPANQAVITRSDNDEPYPYLLAQEYATDAGTMNHIKKPVYEPTLCEKYRYQLAQQIQNIQTKNHMQSTSTENRSPMVLQTGVQDNGLCHPHKYAHEHNTIQPWIQRSMRWRQKLMEIRNLPATCMKRLDSILIPVNNEKYLFPYSDTNAVLGFLTDGSEVLVHIIDMTSRTINSDILRSITSPRNSHYFLVKYRTFAFESGRCYVAMNLPEYSLSEYLSILKSDSRSDPMVVNKLAWQFLKGLSSIHEGLGLQHGNMMPSNIVVDVEGKLMLSEYSFLKPETAKGKFMGLTAVEHDRACWSPSEVITETEPYSLKSDIQVAGMILHYILSGGHHPYGEINLEIQVSLQQNWPKMAYISDEVNGLINDMLVMPPSTRPSMEQILKHPYFWANEKRLRFVLIAGSDVLRDMKSGTSTTGGTGWTMIDIINSACKNAMFCEWTSVVDLVVLKEMRSFRQYKNTLVELVLFVYNCCLHYDKLSQSARDIIDEPCKYFLTTFPALFMSVYTAIKSSFRVERACYKPFF
ncbi:protein PF3D7_1417600-like [Mytilus californianus]|uniref:protein PF3D7_1417600-like n=1 Tax=Mytilus californianus TaxID=6549 RepID=UPI002245029D|nr:protein PF3D7_1417600-like [Mytilus californianus]